MSLTYHLSLEKQNGLLLKIEGLVSQGTRESLLSSCVSAAEKSAIESLFKQGTFKEKQFALSVDGALSWLKALGSTGRLFYEQKKLIVDPFTPFTFFFEAEAMEEGRIGLRGVFKIGSHQGFVDECSGFVPARPTWMIAHGILREIKEDIPLKWIRPLLFKPVVLEKEMATSFLKEFEGEECLIWKTQAIALAVDPIPILKLSDRHGAFADLFFDYGSFGVVGAHESSSPSFRNKTSEMGWERDLLETDFQKKIVDHSHYFCPLDKVGKSLTFLLEIGWTIMDAQKRRLYRQKREDLKIEEVGNQLVVRGKLDYEGHQVDLQNVMGAFNRQEHFVSLSAEAIGLIDREGFSKRFGDLKEEEIVSAGISVPKRRAGLLSNFLEQAPSDFKEKLEKWIQGSPSSAVTPSSDFRATLFSYQMRGLEWLKFLEEGGVGGILADEMGLGKTVQVLAFFSQLKLTKPSLIVVPTSLVFHWKQEMEKFLPSLSLYIHAGPFREKTLEPLLSKSFIITSYALLRQDASLLEAVDYQCIILDEGQAIKNPESQIASVCFRLKGEMRLVISGTPIENRSEDLWSLFHFLLPDLLGERAEFQQQMLAAQLDHRFLERVKKKIQPFLLRRRKKDVALQLPPKFEQTVYVEMTDSQKAIYEKWLQNTRQGLLKKVSLEGASAHRMQILEAILRLRQLCAHPWLLEEPTEDLYTACAKYERLFADLAEVVEEGSKVLIYSQFTQALKLIEKGVLEKGYKYVYLDGSTKNREEIVRKFQEDPEISLFLISLKAGGVGLNLTAADYVFLYDPWWNDAVEQQAIDRAHRVGKTSSVIARRYITALSIEEKILHLKTHKKALSESLLDLDGEIDTSLKIEELLALLN